jgi:hypothetical protein
MDNCWNYNIEELYPWQKNIFDSYFPIQDDQNLLCITGRQLGKTTLAKQLAHSFALNKKSHTAIISPNYKLNSILVSTCNAYYKLHHKYFKIKQFGYNFIFDNDSKLDFLPIDQIDIINYSRYDLVIIDAIPNNFDIERLFQLYSADKVLVLASMTPTVKTLSVCANLSHNWKTSIIQALPNVVPWLTNEKFEKAKNFGCFRQSYLCEL